ncbi:hypothetical protein M758_1G103200 [Ceratodon purpureus]|uniref:Uncharacterized protein n=1 Tax=Ceratodon purpureus TaxID=3225 RepID=A0A8T0J3Y4_CERPU|nr:hypothetical protein KC19_1G114400 [Ceratodon purpureus]KAG0629430.1 hypothetical protein M758_1G103200 [Ceratodon purpureus]
MAPFRGSLGRSVANRFESAAKRASDGIANLKAAAGGAAGGALVGGAIAASEGLVLNGIGFTTVGPAAGSYAAAWMSSIALGNGVGVATGSVYAGLQSAGMSGAAILGGPLVIACSVAGAGACYYYTRDRGGDAPTKGGGDPPATDDSTIKESEELSSEEDATEGDQQID